MKKFAHESLLSVENNSCASPRKIKEVKDNWVTIRATMGTGATGHVMPCKEFRSANVVKPLISMREDVRAGNVVVLDEKNRHFRKLSSWT